MGNPRDSFSDSFGQNNGLSSDPSDFGSGSFSPDPSGFGGGSFSPNLSGFGGGSSPDPLGFDPNRRPSPFNERENSGTNPPPPARKYGLHWLLTLAVLLVTAAALYLVTLATGEHPLDKELSLHLTLDTALYFGVLAASVLLTSFLIELATSAMTPRFSRGIQLIVALVGILLCCLTGTGIQSLYGANHIQPYFMPPVHAATPAPTQTPTPAPTLTPASAQEWPLLFVVDKSGTMLGFRNMSSVASIETLLQNIDDSIPVGLIAFNDEIRAQVPIAANTDAHRADLERALSTPVFGETDFDLVVKTAIEMFRQASLPRGKIVFVTDGVDDANLISYADECLAMNLQVSAVMVNADKESLEPLVNQTGGVFVEASDPIDILEQIAAAIQLTPMPTATSSPTPSPIPSPTPVPNIGSMSNVTADYELYAALMFILVGIILGFSLWLMFSLKGQFRIQLILSPVMGLAAYLLLRTGMTEVWAPGVLLGIVLMRRNNGHSRPATPPAKGSSSSKGGTSSSWGGASDNPFGAKPFEPTP